MKKGFGLINCFDLSRYCRRRYTAMDCITNFTQAATSCLSETENSHKHMFEKMIEKLFGFVCHKDGDQIALFIAEKGPECFADKKDAMWQCVNTTYGESIASLVGAAPITKLEDFDADKIKIPEKLPEFTVEQEQCDQFEVVRVCITEVLEQCEETTPANLFESAAKFVRNESPCKNYTTKAAAQKRNGGEASAKVTASLVVAVGVLGVVGGLFRRNAL